MESKKDVNKLTSLDSYGERIGLIPAEVRGYFRNWRTRVQIFLLLMFLCLPWIQIQGHQAVLLNISRREFNFFGLLFRAHDAPLFFLILAILVMGLAFVTAIWGRIWCGWACPQTVFIDLVFRRIEIWTMGSYIERRKLAQESLSLKKFLKVSLKWILFVVVSSLIAHSFIAYFSGAKELISMMKKNPNENWEYFVLVSFVTGIVLFDFAWFREQFCVIMCPYGRIQSVLLESNSLSIVYDQNRGEPRRGLQDPGTRQGDCIACHRCVEVCPTGIDIRNGLQMECIACTACIDACDEIMRKVNKPEGLIRYQTVKGQGLQWRQPRALLYFVLTALALGGLGFRSITKEPFEATVLRAKDTPFQVLPDGRILNHFKVHVFNQSRAPQEYNIGPSDLSAAQGVQVTEAPGTTHRLAPGRDLTAHVFVSFPPQLLDARGEAKIELSVAEKAHPPAIKPITAVGPEGANPSP